MRAKLDKLIKIGVFNAISFISSYERTNKSGFIKNLCVKNV